MNMEEGQWTTDTTTTINDKAVPPSSTQTTGPSLHASSNQWSRDGFVLASRELPMSGANQSYSVNLKICSKTEEHKNSMKKKKGNVACIFLERRALILGWPAGGEGRWTSPPGVSDKESPLSLLDCRTSVGNVDAFFCLWGSFSAQALGNKKRFRNT